MNIKRTSVILALIAATMWAPAAASAAATAVTVTETLPATLQVGDPIRVTAAAPAGGEHYLLTLTLVDTATGNTTDLEGWLPGSTSQKAPTASGDGAVTWTGKAGMAGHYRVYVTAVPLDHPGEFTSSAPAELTVNQAPAPHADRLMAVSIAEPVVLAIAAVWLLRRRRQSA